MFDQLSSRPNTMFERGSTNHRHLFHISWLCVIGDVKVVDPMIFAPNDCVLVGDVGKL